ncbi:MAG TPA: hypothetical protein VHU44_19045 [Acidobacteriaceae bacterium]|jgi:hypothetical protein|nr:hypothetical protein [Acidobacteriaceae bacterium]
MLRTKGRVLLPAIMIVLCSLAAGAESLDGFTVTGQFRDQVHVFKFEPGVTATMVAPPVRDFHPLQPTTLILYALPNGNTTEWTIGKALAPGDDWHFDIQHIGAQTRLLRAANPGRNLVIVYLESAQKSWPSWRGANANNSALIAGMVATLRSAIPGSPPDIYLTGHSGGGSFTFGFINAFDAIPGYITRIAFLDSNYSFGDDTAHGPKLIAWLRGNSDRRLVVIAYDDRNIELDGKKVVSDTGGTYRATYRMVEAFRKEIPLGEGNVGSYVSFTSPQVEMLVRRNPENKILHTMLVGEFNGFIRAMSDMKPGQRESWERPLASFEGPRAYTGWIERPAPVFTQRVRASTLPPRNVGAPGGAAVMQSLVGLDRDERERSVLRELKSGNIPDFLRHLVPITVKATDAEGREHTAVYQVMPDYLAIGSDRDFVRVPMNPHTAQAFCDAFGFVLPTPKMVDDIWAAAISKIIPQPLTQSREDPMTFLANNRMIEDQIAGQYPGELRAGHKKDVVITNRLNETPRRVAIYGWHFPSGEPIQPLTIVHAEWYVDYSHGIRPVKGAIEVDGADMPYQLVLRDPKLHVLLSNEGVLPNSSYPSEAVVTQQKDASVR